ncbi:MAG TPA: M48 family metalloprotease [Prosthecobacter sp.]
MLPTLPDMTTRVKTSFAGTLQRTPVSFGYRLGMGLVLAGLLLLPLLYLSLVLGISGLVAWHFQHAQMWMMRASQWSGLSLAGSGAGLAGLMYLCMGILGVIFLLFFIKPLFVPSLKRLPVVTLDPAEEKTLFVLVQRICELMGAPMPKEVRVDCSVNAAAGFRTGLSGFFGGHMVLTIGMPLVAGLTARQLAAVLAHEFGHFAQGGAMRLDYLIRTINHWFARAVFERDAWDQKLEALAASKHSLSFLGRAATAMISAGRAILKVLAQAGGVLSGYMSRHMEYDADAHAARMAGGNEYVETLLTIEELIGAHNLMAREFLDLLGRNTLPNNVPSRLQRWQREMPDTIRQKIQNAALGRKTQWWHTHPSLKDRQKRLQARRIPGVFHLDSPAPELFTDFASLCKTVSVHWYAVELGVDLERLRVVDLEEEEKVQEMKDVQDHMVREIFGHVPAPYRLLPLPAAAPDPSVQVALVEALKATYAVNCDQEMKLRQTVLQQTMACRMASLGFPLPKLLGLEVDHGTLEATQAAQAEGARSYQTLSAQMLVFERAAWSRISGALAKHYEQPFTSEWWRQRVGTLTEAQRALATATQLLTLVWVDASLVELAKAHEEDLPADDSLATALREHDQRVRAALLKTIDALASATDPLASKPQKLSDTIRLQELPSARTFYSVVCYPPLIRAVHEHAGRITRELCVLARDAEQASLRAAELERRRTQARQRSRSQEPVTENSAADWSSGMVSAAE